MREERLFEERQRELDRLAAKKAREEEIQRRLNERSWVERNDFYGDGGKAVLGMVVWILLSPIGALLLTLFPVMLCRFSCNIDNVISVEMRKCENDCDAGKYKLFIICLFITTDFTV